MIHPLFWRFSKWGWVTLFISAFIGVGIGIIGKMHWFFLIQHTPLIVAFITLEILSIWYSGLGIKRILSWGERLRHYLKLRPIVQKRGFDPTLTLLCRNTCDQEIIKQLKKDGQIEESLPRGKSPF